METPHETSLRRRLTLPLLVLYGVGSILGAGIYVLIGKVAGYAGMQTPFAFLLAGVLAGLSALSYAELSARFPRSAGVALYIFEGFNNETLSKIIGLLIVAVGMTSTAALLNGLLGYLAEFVQVQHTLMILATVFVLTVIVIWGIRESVLIAAGMTVLEVLGLLIILWVSRDSLVMLPEHMPQLFGISDMTVVTGILLGGFVAFYAYIGFEDMVNVAEEVINPQRNLPRAVIIALIVVTLFYLLIAVTSVLAVAPEQLAESDAPLALIYRLKTGQSATFISLISIVSILNGAIVQMIMASRLLYGMSRNRWLPAILSFVHARTATPIYASLLVSGIVLVLALFLPLLSLAKLTSFFTLVVFALVNLALLRVKYREPVSPVLRVPYFVPALGFVFCTSFVLYQIYDVVG